MKTINFISTGMMGDFIHSLYAVKNICERENAKANVYITDDIHSYGGDIWRMGALRAHSDIKDLVMQQPYINKLEMLTNNFNDKYWNLNTWRVYVLEGFYKQGIYSKSWSEFLSEWYDFKIPKEYKWIDVKERDDSLSDKVLIHRSLHRHNSTFNWEEILKNKNEKFIFLTTNEQEWKQFGFNVELKLVSTISEMATCISSCKYFIGNQSAPFALASALDIPRLVELDVEPAPFYINETKYSNNISWYLSYDKKYFSENSIIKF